MRAERDAYLAQLTSPGHGDHWSGPPEMPDRIAAALATRPYHRVLDLGCGVGGPARRLSGLVGCRVIGLDAREPVVGAAARRSERPSDRAPAYVAGRAERPPFRDAAFDQLWCLGVVAHVGDRGRLAREVRRMLRRDGRVAFTEAFWDGASEPRFRHSAPRPWYPLTSEALMEALAAAGMDDVRALPWPGGRPDEVRDRNLRADLADGRLRPQMVVARRP